MPDPRRTPPAPTTNTVAFPSQTQGPLATSLMLDSPSDEPNRSPDDTRPQSVLAFIGRAIDATPFDPYGLVSDLIVTRIELSTIGQGKTPLSSDIRTEQRG